jgi:hypothetical protein
MLPLTALILLFWLALVLMALSTYFYIRILRLAKKHNKHFFVPYGHMKTWKQFNERAKNDYGILIRNPKEFKDKELVSLLAPYRYTYWISIACFATIIFLL